MVMQSVALADRITLETGTGGGVRVRTNLSFLPTNEKNLAAAAALQFLEDCGLDCGGLSISVEKHIPVCAGTGGGSSDAAAALRGLNRLLGAGYSGEALARLGERVGSDVPYCVLGGTALAEGRGEVLTPLPALPRCHAVLCKPAFSISTPELFARVDGVKLRHRPDTDVYKRQAIHTEKRAESMGRTRPGQGLAVLERKYSATPSTAVGISR